MDLLELATTVGTMVVIPTVVALWHALQSERAAHRETLMKWREADQRRIEMLERLALRPPEDR